MDGICIHAQRNEKSNQFGYFCKANFSIGNSTEPISLFRLKVTSFTSKQSVDYDYREAAKKSGTQDGIATYPHMPLRHPGIWLRPPGTVT